MEEKKAAAVKVTPMGIVDDARDRPWKVAIDPFRVAPRMYYIGNVWVGSFLIDTEEGLAIIDTTVMEDLYMLTESIRKLGFDPKNIKKIFLTHAHMDHDGAAQALKELSGAEIYLAKEDEEWRHRPEADMSDTGFKIVPYEVDHFYDDNTPIVMGSVTIRTKLSAGHTPGCTSFFVEMPDENGNKVVWGMHGGVGVNTMNTKYLQEKNLPLSLQDDFLRGCEEMKSIHVDICTPSHPSHSDMLSRIAEDRMDYTPFVDAEKWPAFLDERAESLRKVLEAGDYVRP